MNKRVQTGIISTDKPGIRGLVVTWVLAKLQSIVTIDTLIEKKYR